MARVLKSSLTLVQPCLCLVLPFEWLKELAKLRLRMNGANHIRLHSEHAFSPTPHQIENLRKPSLQLYDAFPFGVPLLYYLCFSLHNSQHDNIVSDPSALGGLQGTLNWWAGGCC